MTKFDSPNVLWNMPQTLTDPQKLQARNNIGAAALASLAASFESRAPGYAWNAGEVCTYGGKLWQFDSNHSGAWTGADAHEVTILKALANGIAEHKIFNFASNNLITQTRYNSYLNNANCEFYLYLKNGVGVLTGWFNPSSAFNVSYENTDIGGNSSWPVILLLDVTDIETTNFLSQGSFLFKGDTYNNNFEFVCSTMNIVYYNNKKYLSIGIHAVGLNVNRSYNFNPSTLIL